ncbi:MAG: hypothetical protein AB1491_12705 [Thermodesulfobacteriota bacterium]
MSSPRSWRWLLFLVVLSVLAGHLPVAAEASAPRGNPPRPQLVEPAQAPYTAKILGQVALNYEPQMSPEARDLDFLKKIRLVKKLLRIGSLVELRHLSLALLTGSDEVSWEKLRTRRWPQGDKVGVLISLPVWVPAQARRVITYAGFEKRWQTVAYNLPRPSGYVWFAPNLAQINDKAHYRPERTQVEMNSKFAPLAALFLEYIFREGWYDPARRLPLVVVRAGEDTYAASAYSGPVEAECLSFPDDDGDDFTAQVIRQRYDNLAEIHHGRHSPTSNHRLGLALDLNDFNFSGVVDGPPNPISRATRQYNRDAMHKLDARHLPGWVYRSGKWVGFRLPQEWSYFGFHTDWPHFDVGTR